MTAIALVRCSTAGQDLDHQIRAANEWGRVNGFTIDIREEQATSGKAKSRPVLDKIMSEARKGDVKTVWVRELSRLGRSLVQVVQVLSELHTLGVRVVVQKEGIDYSSPAGRMQAQILAALAEFERELIVERTKSGLAAARARGVRLGTRPDEWPAETDERLKALQAAGVSLPKMVKDSRVTVKRPCKDKKTGEWTWKWASPGRTKVWARLRELGVR